jgi:hypothetical protein
LELNFPDVIIYEQTFDKTEEAEQMIVFDKLRGDLIRADITYHNRKVVIISPKNLLKSLYKQFSNNVHKIFRDSIGFKGMFFLVTIMVLG